jgi:hypothetical protein
VLFRSVNETMALRPVWIEDIQVQIAQVKFW